MCKVAQGQVVQEEAEAECSLRNADVVDDTVSCSPPPSPLDSVVIDLDHSPRSAFDAAGNCKIEIVKVQDIHSTYMSEPIFATKTAALG